ncbi:hypothetical protein M3Y98_00340900 [Aphelenchoides besseyi]|nr:hypothetical protein M3Y98_00340900 [Aphelenchoides besseyi]
MHFFFCSTSSSDQPTTSQEPADRSSLQPKSNDNNTRHDRRSNRLHSNVSSDDSIFKRDPYNQREIVNTLKGRELIIFVVFYIVAVMIILCIFEAIMPVVLPVVFP